MLNKSYPKPSTVMINSYNAKINALMTETPFELLSWSVSDDTTTGVVDVVVKNTQQKETQAQVKRFDLKTLIPATAGEFAVLDTDEMFNVIDTQYEGGLDEAIELLHNTTKLNHVGEILRDEEVERTLVGLWVTRQLYIPITDVILNYLGEDAYVLNYCQTTGKRLYESYEIVAKPNSIGYIGSAKVIVAANEEEVPVDPVDPPVEEVPGEFDLGKVTNNGTPGHWTLMVDVESDEVPEAPALIDLTLAAVNTAYDTTITTGDVTSNLEGKTLTIYTLKENISSITGTLIVTVILNITPPPVVRFDLSTITNGDELGVWSLDINEGELSEVTAQSATQSVLDVFNASSDIQITYDQLDVVKEDTLITVTPSKAGAEVLEGSFIITLNVINNEVPQSNTGLAADYPGTGWYKATDTGTVFCKGVPALDTQMFEEGGLEFVSVVNKTQLVEYGARAATSNVTDMSSAFAEASFNEDISSWDTSNVTNMAQMFYSCSEFNQDISSWDTSNVTNMFRMFVKCYAFNQNIGGWDTSNVTNMSSMFFSCYAFNQDIGGWDTSNVSTMTEMFYSCYAFNQDLSEWCVTHTSSTPSDFNSSASAWTLPRPVWGTCPRGEDGSVVVTPESTPEWTVVDWKIDNFTGDISDASRFSQEKVSGIIKSNKAPFEPSGGLSGHISAAYYTLAVGEHLRLKLKIPGTVNTDTILLPKTVKGVSWFNETNAIEYPCVAFSADPDDSMKFNEHGSYYLLFKNNTLELRARDPSTGVDSTTFFDYNPGVNDSLNIDYHRKDGQVFINVAGVHNLAVSDVNATIAMSLKGTEVNDVGGVMSFTSENVTDTLVKPDWIIASVV